ncbi:hypothetical protein T492DRAFT_988233 [Pavlovales sp. CCMP2436]|nr:hypothetical protein T492DRAFT_988233 [Pavlovales sp. CCMP2436]|mmetsp:Transcript_7459/g.17815  ORF Transcript_7459/g.17815 Transcript_7459/m.17815 type:complete len:340 (-) Transcript_7459:200-1219(-)
MALRAAPPRTRASVIAECLTEVDVRTAVLANELGLLEGALARSRERVRSFKQERKGQRELIGQTLQMALAGCQGRVAELDGELEHVRQESAERIAHLEQELTRDKRVRAVDNSKDDDGTLSIGSLGSGKLRATDVPRYASPPPRRPGSESRRITELENELTAMHVKVDTQQNEIELLRTAVAYAEAGAAGSERARPAVGLRDIENAISVQQEEYKTMISELEEHVRSLESELVGARRALGSKDGVIAAVEHEAGAARSQLMQTEAVLERKQEDILQLTSQLQVCILELKALSEKSREAQSRQRNVFELARVNSSLNNRFLPHHELESRPGVVPAAVVDT